MTKNTISSPSQKEAVSLILAFMGSLFVLTVVTFSLISLSRSFQDSAKMERHSRSFYAVESGIEAALYHHNARGAGVLFDEDNEPSQTLNLSNMETYWKLKGRSDHITGLLKEGETVSIPLFQDDASNPTEAYNRVEIPFIESIQFGLSDNTHGQTNYDDFRSKYGEDVDVQDFFWASGGEQKALINWSLDGQKDSELYSVNPRPASKENPCIGAVTSSFICVNDINPNYIFNGSSGETLILPGASLGESLNTEISASNFTNKIFSFESLLSFTSDTNKIPGIPYSVRFFGSSGALSVPTPTFLIEVDTKSDEFGQSIVVEIPERTKNSSFDYQIFD